MRHATALELRTRLGAETPVLVVFARKRSAEGDHAVRSFDQAAVGFGVEAVAVDVDGSDNAALVNDLGIRFAPEALLIQRGVVLERCAGVRDADDAFAVLACALRKSP